MSKLNWATRLDSFIWMDEINSKKVDDAIKAANALRILKNKEAIYYLTDAIETRMKDTLEGYVNILTEMRITRKLAPLKDTLKKEFKNIEFSRKLLDPIRRYFKEQRGKTDKDLKPDQIKSIQSKMTAVQNYIRELRSTFNNALRQVNPKNELEKLNITTGREKGALEAFLKDMENLDKFSQRDNIIEDMKNFYENQSKFYELAKAIFEILVKIADGVLIDPYVKKLKSMENELGNQFAVVLAELGQTNFLERVQKAKKSNEHFKSLMTQLLDEIEEIPGKSASVQFQTIINKHIGNAKVIIAIIQALGAICTENEATDTLLELLNLLDLEVQRKFLDRIVEQSNILEIAYSNLKRKYDLIIAEIFKALGKFEDSSITTRVLKLLDSDNIAIKRRAIILLAKLGDSKIMKELARLLNDDDLLIQKYAMIALKQMVPFLKGMEKSEVLHYINLNATPK